MITKMHYIHEIVINLSVLRYVVESDARNGFYDIPKACEDLFMEIFNIVYAQNGWKFQNMNNIKPNYPAIDLGDVKNKIGIQITCQSDSTKIQDTLDVFERSPMNLPSIFSHLFIFLLTRKPNYTKKFSFPVSGKKYSKKHILSIDDFIDSLDGLDISVLEQLCVYIKNNIQLGFGSASPSYKSIAKAFPEFGSRKHQTLNKLGVQYPDKSVDAIYDRIVDLPLDYRLAFYTFVKKSYKQGLKMKVPVFDSFVKSINVTYNLDDLLEGPLALLSSDDAEPRSAGVISIRYEDTWKLILDNVDEIWWEQLIVYADFTLLD